MKLYILLFWFIDIGKLLIKSINKSIYRFVETGNNYKPPKSFCLAVFEI